jgi:RNA polymerase sigma-70 factor (ECF subfamily)
MYGVMATENARVHPPASRSPSDDELWRRVRNGQAEAFGVLYERHSRKVYNYLFRRLGDWADAEELTAVVFAEAFRRRMDVVIDEGKVAAWLLGVATNTLRNQRRSRWRHRELLREIADAVVTGPLEPAQSETVLQMRELLAALRRLPRDQRDVVALCVWSQLSYEDAAAALRVPVGTVRSRLARARQSLALVTGRRSGPSSTNERMVEA